MIVDRYGGVFRRPGLKYISTVKTFAAFTNVSYEGSGTLYGITEFGDLSDPPRKYRNLISNNSALARWTPGGSYNGIQLSLYGRVNYNAAPTKTEQVANNQLLGNAGLDFNLYGSPPAGTPDWIGLFATSASGGGVLNTLEGYDPGGAIPPSLTGNLEGTWVRNKQKKGWLYSTLPAVSGDDANSPAWFWQSHAIGSTTSSTARATLNVYAVCGSSVWTVYVFYQMEAPSTGTGPSTQLYVKFADGDNAIDASTDGAYITGNNGASGSPSYIYAKFSAPKDTSMRFYLTITGFTPGQFPRDWSASSFPITDDEIQAAGGRNWFYLPDVSTGVEGDDEYAELLTVEDKPIDFLASSGASGVTVGAEEWAFTSSFTGGITAESHSPINYTQRIVKSTYNLTGLTTGYTYPVTLVYQQKDYPTGLNITAPSEIVNVVATGASMAVEAEIIAPVDKQRKLVSATAGVGVAPVSVTTRDSYSLLWAGKVTENSGAYTTADLDALDAFAASLRANSLINALGYCLPMVGSDINAAMVPFFDRSGLGIADKAAGSAAFVDADFSRTGGLQGNGTSKLVKVPFTPGQLSSSGVISHGVDVRNADSSGTSGGLFSVYWNNGNNNLFGLRTTGTTDYRWAYGQVGVTPTSIYTPGGGTASTFHLSGTTRSTSDKELYLDGVSVATAGSGGSQWSNTNDSDWPLVGDTLTGGLRYYAGRIGCAWWRSGSLTGTQMANVHTAVTALNTAISRT